MGNSQSRNTSDSQVSSTIQQETTISQLFGRERNEGERTVESLETRRRLKEEKEARRIEKEKVVREQLRERSMKNEHVDGGYLVTHGVYSANDDFNYPIVRQAIIERRLAPFWRGLNDYSSTLTEHQLVALARGLPLPAADAIPEPEPEETKPYKDLSEQAFRNLTIPVIARAPSAEPSRSWGGDGRARARTTSGDVTPDFQLREITLPKQPNVNGQPLEAYLYKNADDCPICFLAYPPYLNSTRCCYQPICSECFCQIARKPPHVPEAPEGAQPQANVEADPDTPLISEPACCPYCAMPEFGVTYTPPPFPPRGLAYASSRNGAAGGTQDQAGRRRAASLAASHPSVITTDRIRPYWVNDLAQANMVRSRRNAAATALHTAAYLMNGRDSRLFSRRPVLRRPGESPGSSSSQLSMLAMMADRYNAANQEEPESSPVMSPPPRMSSRRNRMEDLEDMMMMEAIRLSLAAEQERQSKEQRQEQKDKKKADKQKAKDDKKAEKAAKKGGLYPAGGGATSSSQLDTYEGKGKEPARPIDVPGRATESPQSYLERSRAQILIDSPQSATFPASPFRPSHLRNISGVSSSASSLIEPGRRHAGSVSSLDGSPTASGIHLPRDEVAGTPPGGGAGLEPMFNFRSLAAMIGDEDKKAASPLVEHWESAGEVLPDPLHDELDLSSSPSPEKEDHPLAQTMSAQDSSLSSKELDITQTTTANEPRRAVQ